MSSYRRGGAGGDLLQEAPLTIGLIAVNVARLSGAADEQRHHLHPEQRHDGRRGSPCRAPSTRTTALWGPMVAEGEWWRLLTSGFLHASPLHIGSNMLALFFIGRAMEPALGSVRLGLIYFVSLAAGSLGVMILEPGCALDRRLGRDLRSHGRPARDRPRARHQPHPERHRARDPAQSGDSRSRSRTSRRARTSAG